MKLKQKHFYLTGLLLNYDISFIILNKTYENEETQKFQVVKKIFKLLLNFTQYPFELLFNKFIKYTKWFDLNIDKLVRIIIDEIDTNSVTENNENVKNVVNFNQIKKNIQDYYNFLNQKNIIFKKIFS